MRILHLICQYAGDTGSGIYLQSITRESKKRGHIQGVVYAVNEKELKEREFEYTNIMKFDSDKIPFPIVGMSDIMPYDSRTFKSLNEIEMNILKGEYKRSIYEAVGEFKPDVIITNHLWIMSSMVKELFPNIPVFGICHGTDLRQLETNMVYAKEVKSGIARLDGIFVSSQRQLKEVSEVYSYDSDKIEVIGGGYRNDIFYYKGKPFLKGRSKYIEILYCGKLSFAKGLVELIKAVEKVSLEYNVRLNIVGSGSGDECTYIRSMFKSSGLRIRHFGKLEQNYLSKLMRNMDIFVMPSYYEGLSLVTIEALASGNLIVSNSLINLQLHLTDKINKVDFIEYVKSPSMLRVDTPLESEKSIYINELYLKISQQIVRLYVKNEEYYNKLRLVTERLREISWSEIYGKIEKRIEKELTS